MQAGQVEWEGGVFKHVPLTRGSRDSLSQGTFSGAQPVGACGGDDDDDLQADNKGKREPRVSSIHNRSEVSKGQEDVSPFLQRCTTLQEPNAGRKASGTGDQKAIDNEFGRSLDGFLYYGSGATGSLVQLLPRQSRISLAKS
jgi:hypothetical protein